jgi:transposase
VVVDPTYAAMYGSRSRKVKTDKRDVAALALANRRGVFRCAHRVPAATRTLRQQLRIRRQLVQQRTGLMNLLRAVVRQEGLRLPSGQAASLLTRVERLGVPAILEATLAPLRTMLTALNATLATLDAALAARAATDPVTQRLMTAPGVGPIVALTFQAVLDTPDRFGGDAGRASAFVGLVPREDSSAERQHKGSITKTGPGDLRALLVQASWALWHSRSERAAPLRLWAQALSARRGRRIAVVAVARRLTRVLYAMWRDRTEFRVPAAVAA